MEREQSHLFGIGIDRIAMSEAVARIIGWAKESGEACRYVVTPNVDHAVLLRDHTMLQAAYGEADLVLADGHPIVWASRLLGKPVPERVPGSDLVPAVFDAVACGQRTIRVFLLGAAPGVAARAAEKIHARWPGVEVVGCYSPPLGFENDDDESNLILGRLALAAPDLLIVGLGAPKQEVWVHRHAKRLPAKVALCVGATIDFLAGEKKRAPVWMQRTGTEWLHRVCTEPKRLAGRYLRDAWVFPQLILQQWVSDRTARDHR